MIRFQWRGAGYDDNGERMKKGRESFESLFKWPVSSESFGRCYMW